MEDGIIGAEVTYIDPYTNNNNIATGRVLDKIFSIKRGSGYPETFYMIKPANSEEVQYIRYDYIKTVKFLTLL
jgi:hypothetical protein